MKPPVEVTARRQAFEAADEVAGEIGQGRSLFGRRGMKVGIRLLRHDPGFVGLSRRRRDEGHETALLGDDPAARAGGGDQPREDGRVVCQRGEFSADHRRDDVHRNQLAVHVLE